MPRPVRLVIRTLRYLLGVLFAVVLLASLVLWPRSYFYCDSIDGICSNGTYRYGFVATWTGMAIGDWTDYSTEYQELTGQPASQWPRYECSRFATQMTLAEWLAQRGLFFGPMPILEHTAALVELSAVTALSLVGLLAVSMPCLWPAIRKPRLKMADFLIVVSTTSVGIGWGIVAVNRHGVGGGVIVVEATLLLLVAYAAIRHARTTGDARKWVSSAVAASCLGGACRSTSAVTTARSSRRRKCVSGWSESALLILARRTNPCCR